MFFVATFVTASGSMVRVPALMSANTGWLFWYTMALAVAANVSGDVMASSPAPSPAAQQAACNAAVPLEKATACFAPPAPATASSNLETVGPWVSQSPLSVSTTAATSESSSWCRA